MEFFKKIANNIVSRVLEDQTKKQIELMSKITELEKSISKSTLTNKQEEPSLSTIEELNKLTKRIKEVVEQDSDSSVLLLSRLGKSHSTLILGSKEDIADSIRFASKEDGSFSNLVAQVGHDLFMNEINDKEQASYLSEEKNSSEISKEIHVPGVGNVLGIRIDDVDNISNDQVDDIINKMIGKSFLKKDVEDEDEKNEE